MAAADAFIMRDATFARGQQADGFRPFVAVMTRFANAAHYAPASLTEDLAPLKTWLAGRIPLFQKFCLPSIQRQILPPDAWLHGVRVDLVDHVEGLDVLGGAPSMIAPQQQLADKGEDGSTQFEGVARSFMRVLAGRIPEDRTHLITVRLDSDDVVHPYFLAVIARYFSAILAQKPEITDAMLSLAFGAQTDGTRYSTVTYPIGPFQARMESLLNQKFATVYAKSHIRFFDHENAYNALTACPMWLQLLHGENVANAFRPKCAQFADSGNIPEIFGFEGFDLGNIA
jgi:hypothetical protein